MTSQLYVSGLAARELQATSDLVPPGIAKIMRANRMSDSLNGFGLSAKETGCGKTSAFAVRFRNSFRTMIQAEGDDFENYLLWVSWPDQVNWIRRNATSPSLNDQISDMCRAQALFLDDLGSERISKSYVEDFAASHLDTIVNTRYRKFLPIFYTTNLDTAGLTNIYGAHLVSRLVGANPLFCVDGLSDMRISHVNG